MRRFVLSSLACGLLAACHSDQQSENSSGVGPKIDGDKITFAADAPQKASFTCEAAKPIEQSIIHLTGRLV